MAGVLLLTVLAMLVLGPVAIVFFSARTVYRHPEKGGRWLPVTCGLGAAALFACSEAYGVSEFMGGTLVLGSYAVAIPLLRFLRRHEGMLVRRSWPLWAAMALILALPLAIVCVVVVALLLHLLVGDFSPIPDTSRW